MEVVAGTLMAVTTAFRERQRHMRHRESIIDFFRHQLERYRSDGRVRDYNIDHRDMEYDGTWSLRVAVWLFDTANSERLNWQFRETELMMHLRDGDRLAQVVNEWWGTIRRELDQRLQGARHLRRGRIQNDPIQPGGIIFVDEEAEINRNWFHSAHFPPHQGRLSTQDWERMVTRREEEQRRHEAAKVKARALFAHVAGEQAAAQLERDEQLPLRGSQGGEYALLKRSAYCVRRLKDGAELCAVVPNVPLWDHLLGIKLLVEQDEPRFLRTANVSGGMTAGPRGITAAAVRAGERMFFGGRAMQQHREEYRRLWEEQRRMLMEMDETERRRMIEGNWRIP